MISIDVTVSFVKHQVKLLLTYEAKQKRQKKIQGNSVLSTCQIYMDLSQNEDNTCLGNHFA